jgi:hypothetical protein
MITISWDLNTIRVDSLAQILHIALLAGLGCCVQLHDVSG